MMRASACMGSAGGCFSFSVCLTVLPFAEESRLSSPPEGVAVRDWRAAPSLPLMSDEGSETSRVIWTLGPFPGTFLG